LKLIAKPEAQAQDQQCSGYYQVCLGQGVDNNPGPRLAETSERWGVDPIQISSARMEARPTMPDRALILIVEDNEVDLMLIRRAFAKAKVLNPLFSVQTGEEAIAYFKGDGCYANRAEYPLPDLVLLDLKLTGISGFQVLKWIRQQPGLWALRVVVLTGSTAIEDINLAYQLGANSFLAKPMDFDSFVQVAGSIAGYWLWMNETPEVSRSVADVKGSGANIDSTSGESARSPGNAESWAKPSL
jgi:CheY-like chemotaxis protein